MIRDADVKRLKTELRTIWTALYESLQAEHPKATKKELREMTRTRFLQVVDDAAREVAAEV
jgi:hypothetical protein